MSKFSMNKIFLSVLVASCCLALVSSFTVLPKATTMVRPIVQQPDVKVAPLNVMMVDMTGGALADVSPVGSIIMLVLVVALWEFTYGGMAKKE